MMIETWKLGALCGGAIWLVALTACYEAPFEPGSDLQDVGPAVLYSESDAGLPDAPAEEGADINGRFDFTGSLPTPVGPEPIEVTLLLQAVQQGTITAGNADIDLLILNSDDPDLMDPPPPSFLTPVDIDEVGAFDGTVVDLVIPQDFSDLLAADANSDVRFEGRILDSDCFLGRFTLTLKEAALTIADNPVTIPLENGEFQAVRQGATCNFDAVSGEEAP